MIKKTLCFTNPTYLSLHQCQLVIRLPEVVENENLSNVLKEQAERTIPVEDIGVVVLDHRRITITSGALDALLENNCAVITCNAQGHPVGLLLPLSGNTLQSERFREQIASSLPLRVTGNDEKCMQVWAEQVRSGDPDNIEARAAAHYWQHLFPELPHFVRAREGEPPNNLLNYGYAILRAVVARALVGSGLLPTLGIHHHNRYNAYCLADDIMEPYRPYVDRLVLNIIRTNGCVAELTRELKSQLLVIPTLDVVVNGKRSPLMIAVQQTTASLYKCFSGELRRVSYPEM